MSRLTIMNLCKQLCLPGQPAEISLPFNLYGKNINVGQTINIHSFTFAMLTGTIDCYPFVPLLVALTLVEGHKVSRKESMLASCFPTDQDEIRYCIEAIQVEHCNTTLSKRYVMKGSNCCLLTVSKNKVYKLNWFLVDLKVDILNSTFWH